MVMMREKGYSRLVLALWCKEPRGDAQGGHNGEADEDAVTIGGLVGFLG